MNLYWIKSISAYLSHSSLFRPVICNGLFLIYHIKIMVMLKYSWSNTTTFVIWYHRFLIQNQNLKEHDKKVKRWVLLVLLYMHIFLGFVHSLTLRHCPMQRHISAHCKFAFRHEHLLKQPPLQLHLVSSRQALTASGRIVKQGYFWCSVYFYVLSI